MSDGDSRDNVEELGVKVQTLEAKVDQMVSKRVEQLEQTVQEREETIEALAEELDECHDRISTLEEKLAGLAGLQENEKSTAKKRREDLVLSLQRKAEDGVGKAADGRASMTYEDVLDQWAILGHGRKDPKQAYRAMERVDEVDGISLTKNNSGQKVVRINLANFDSSTALGVIDNVNNGEISTDTENVVTHGD